MAIKMIDEPPVEEAPPKKITLLDNPPPMLPPDQVKTKASKFNFLLGEESPGEEVISQGLDNGYEDHYRGMVADKAKINFLETRRQMIEDLVATQKGPATADEVAFLSGMSELDFAAMAKDPENIFESEYAKKFMATAMQNDEFERFIRAQQEDPEEANRILDRYEENFTKIEIAKRHLDDVNREVQEQSIGETAWNFGWTVLNPLDPFSVRNAIDTPSVGSILPGNNLAEQYQYLATLPQEEYSRVLAQTIAELKDSNPYAAQRFAQGLIGFSTDDENLENFWGVLAIGDVALTALGVGGALKAGRAARAKRAANAKPTEAKQMLQEALKAATKAGAQPGPPDVGKTAGMMGNIRAAAIAGVVKRQISKLNPKVTQVPGGSAVLDNLPSISRPKQFFEGYQGKRATASLDQLVEAAEANDGVITRALTQMDSVIVDPAERIANVARKLWDTHISGVIRPLQNAILDVQVDTDNVANFVETVPLTNTQRLSIPMGTRSGELFKTADAAGWMGKSYGLESYQIRPQGGGYVIDAKFDLPTDVADLRAGEVPNVSKSNHTFMNQFLGWVRSSKGVLSQGQNDARLAVIHGQQKFAELYSDIAEPIRALNKTELDEMNVVWKHNRDTLAGPPESQLRGKWFETLGEFETYFYQRFKKLPTDGQVNAYHTYMQLNDMDYLVRSASWYRDKVRVGIKQLTIDGIPTTGGVLRLEGKVVDPKTITFSPEKPVGVAVFDPQLRDFDVFDTRHTGDVTKINEALAKRGNYRLVQAADANFKIPGKARGSVGIGFVLTPNVQVDAVSLVNKYRAGGHVIQRYSFYAKQGNIEDDTFGKSLLGDRAIFGAPTQALARRKVDAFNHARQNLRTMPYDELDAFVAKELGMTGREFQKLFVDQLDDKGNVIAKGLREDIPVVMTRQGQRSTDVMDYGADVRDLTKSEYNLLEEMNRKFAGERDNQNLRIFEEEGDTLIRKDEGELLDPMETIKDASRNVIDLRFKKDYTNKSAMEWTEEFKDILEVDRSKLTSSPMAILYNPTYKRNADSAKIRMAKITRQHILRFVGGLNNEETIFEVVKQKARDIAYDRFGKKGLDIVDDWVVPMVEDPLTMMRSIAFHAKLGLFNPQQVFVQAQAMVAMSGLSPTHGLAGWAAYPWMRAALINPKHLDFLAQKASGFGWKADEFKEMFEAFDNSGWGIIKGSTSLLDEVAAPSVFKSSAGKVLDAGTVFFEEGEKISRLASYATAYREWKVANKGKQFDRYARQWVLNRADDLTLNMSAAHQAIWQRGVLGVPMQFFSYQARLTEAFLGKRLTAKEKMQLFAVQSAMYGVPVATGGVVGVWPVAESVKAYLMENGIDYNDGMVEAVVQGIPAMIAGAAGFEVDPGTRYGAGGIPVLREWAQGQKGLGEILLGASGTVVGDTLASVVPSMAGMASIITGQNEFYGFAQEDVVAASRHISTINNALRMWTALETGKWMTKNGVTVDEVTAAEAIYMGLTGDQLDRISDSYTKIELMNNRREVVKEVQKEVIESLRRSMDDDPSVRRDMVKRAWGIAQAGGLTNQEFTQATKNFIRGLNEDQVFTVDKNFAEDYRKAQQMNKLGE